MALRCRNTIGQGARRCGLGGGHIGACVPVRSVARLVQAYACPTHHHLAFSYAPGSCSMCPRDLVLVGA